MAPAHGRNLPPVLGSTTTSWRDPSGPVHQPESRPDPGRPEGTDLIPQIDHVVVLVMENHSFDNYFGMLGRGDGFGLDTAGAPTNANPDAQGRPVRAYHFETTRQREGEPDPTWNAAHLQWNGGANDGFVRSGSGRTAMGYWTGDDLPFYWALARTFPLCDRYFASALTQTFPNRRFMWAGTALGMVTTDLPAMDEQPPNGTLFDRLNDVGVEWRNYYGDLPEPALFPPVWFANTDRGATYDDFCADAAAGRLPAFSLVTPRTDLSEENPQDIQEGEAFSARIIHAVLDSPCWERTLMVFTYDEHGGYYDHVAPPAAVEPDDIEPLLDPDFHVPGRFDRLGFRVPCLVLSPYARPDHVSHVIHDHTSVLRLLETKWNLGALTRRDANASNLLDCLDLSRPPAFLEPPVLPSPALVSRSSAVEGAPSPAKVPIVQALGRFAPTAT
jgi:phospholipase C